MNIEDTGSARHAGPPPLPELTEERIDELEEALFAAIDQERLAQRRTNDREQAARRARRRRTWIGAGAAAGVLVLALAIAPNLGNLGVLGASSGAMTDERGVVPAVGFAGEDGAAESAGDSAVDSAAGGDLAEREIIATASADVEVPDAALAAQQIGDAAAESGGYVEAMSIGEEGGYIDRGDGVSYPYPGTAWISVRVPAAELTATISGLDEIGEVSSSRIDRRDVTSEAVDLRARIDALEASVQRLTELMADATSTADLLAAESALADRQAELESYQQQLTSLDDQVALSSLTVTLNEPAEVVTADPAGFGDGIAAGWNGLVATLNGVVVALGFLLPWLAVVAVVGAIVWSVRRVVKRRRATASVDRPEV